MSAPTKDKSKAELAAKEKVIAELQKQNEALKKRAEEAELVEANLIKSSQAADRTLYEYQVKNAQLEATVTELKAKISV